MSSYNIGADFLQIEVLQICNDALFAVMTQQGVQASIQNASNVELQFLHGVFWVGKGEAS